MKRQIWLIRHGKTRGNMEFRYVGRSDEPLCPAGREALEEKKGLYPVLSEIYVSPMIRCRQTGEILFPGAAQHVLPGMEECDFGDFEYKNYEEMNGYPAYQDWIDSGGTSGFPGGETMEAFADRVNAAFLKMMRAQARQAKEEPLVLVCHGGCIMAILDRFSRPHQDYFTWLAQNGSGFKAVTEMDDWAEGLGDLSEITSLEAL